MECKPLDQVRVAEIAAAAGVSKQTFYHHFSDKYHLMEYCFRDMFAAPFERMGTLAPFDECYIEFLQLCHERKTFLRNAFTSQDVNSLYRVMHHALRDAYGARVRVFGVLDQEETGFCLDFFSKGCAGCTRYWFDQGMDFEDAELVGLIRECIPVGVGILGTQRIAVNASPSPVCASAFALLGARCGSFGLSAVLVAKNARDAQWRHGAFNHPSKVG